MALKTGGTLQQHLSINQNINLAVRQNSKEHKYPSPKSRK